jgi:acetolactate synthase-1/2/3 large subunit
MTSTVDGGSAVARTLKAAGVSKIFALHGGHLDAAFKGFLDNGIELVDTRHETSAGHAAEAWARLTGDIGVCMITAGPGFTNALTSMMNALLDGTPVLFMAGSPPLREEGLNILQGGVDQVAMATPATKHAIRITDPDRIPDMMAHAITIARGGRPGPVFIELPIDILARPARLPSPMPRPVAPAATRPIDSELSAIVAALQAAKRPVIVLGGLARYQATPEQLRAFVDRTGMPLVATSRAMGMIAEDHPAYAHEPASIAAAMAGGQAPDLILMLGSRYGMFLAGRTRAFFPDNAKIVQVHSDAAEFGRIHQPDFTSSATIGGFVDAVAAAWQQPADSLRDWRDTMVGASRMIGSEFTAKLTPGGISPYFAAKAVVEAAPDGTTFVIEGGEAGLWGAYHARVSHPGGVCTYGQLGSLGIGMGFAIGAAHARPGHPVIQITGDGAVGFHLQEFEPMVRQRLPIVTVVLNNNAWGMSLHGQQILYGANYSAISVLGDVRYHEVAKGFGCYGERVTSIEEIGPAIHRALASGLPGCIDVSVDVDVVAPGTSAMLGDGGPKEIMVPYYENIPLD